jgi:hypothetical protein
MDNLIFYLIFEKISMRIVSNTSVVYNQKHNYYINNNDDIDQSENIEIATRIIEEEHKHLS